MFENVCALLLRLYPADFRRAYGREAVQLMRDRARHERGVVLRIRLLIDLAIDLCATSLHGWQPAKPLLAQVDGAPRFDIIAVHGPRPEALAAGMLTSVFVFATFTLSFQPKALPNAPAHRRTPSGSAKPRAGSNDSAQQAVATDSEAHHTLIVAIAANLKQLYVDRAIGHQLADALLAHNKSGDYESFDMGANLAARINTDIHTTARALGISRGVFVADVVYSAQMLPTGPPPPITEEMRERNRAALLQQNCLFETIETLPHNVGYLKLNGFGEATACRETTGRVMASLNNAVALIVDLRDNGGGFGDTALQIAGYLFDRPTYFYDPRPNSPVPARTASPMSGNTLADKPVYVLTSPSTQSAAEYFVYNLKMLKRATVVGETTAGHQHSGAFHRINDHFGMGIQEGAPPDNPYAVKGWEVIGVEPDMKVPGRKALDVVVVLVLAAAIAPLEAVERTQAPTSAADRPRFDVASVKATVSRDPRVIMSISPGGRLTVRNVPLRLLIRRAYQLQEFQLDGGPKWLDDARFDVVAQGATSATSEQVRLMLQSLLADRFKLTLHNETRDQPLYALVLSRRDRALGPDLKRTEADCSQEAVWDGLGPSGGPPDPDARCGMVRPAPGGMVQFRGVTLEALARFLSTSVHRPVIDRSGLAGFFDAEFELTAELGPPPPPPGMPDRFDRASMPSIFTVLQERLGLKLDPRKGPVAVFVIDRLEHPTEN